MTTLVCAYARLRPLFRPAPFSRADAEALLLSSPSSSSSSSLLILRTSSTPQAIAASYLDLYDDDDDDDDDDDNDAVRGSVRHVLVRRVRRRWCVDGDARTFLSLVDLLQHHELLT